jgi:cysteine desulfurase/selenocysteine lyase
MLDIDKVRADFPILKTRLFGNPLVYLDNAATTQKPQLVLEAITTFYGEAYSNVHRGTHQLSEDATAAYEHSRETVRDYIGAADSTEIIFTSGTTESINLVASSFGQMFVGEGDEIVISEMEHHSNIVPWQSLCKRKGAVLKVIPFADDGQLIIDRLDELISGRTKLVAVTHVSNVLGIVNDVKEVIARAHAHDVPVLIDAAQAVQHMPVDVQDLDSDFFAFSGHKMYAGTGIGVLHGKREWLEAIPPYQHGGGMISSVSIEETTYADLPFKFEAGTGNITGAVSLAAAIEYITGVGLDKIARYELDLMNYASESIGAIDEAVIYGEAPDRCGALSFNLEGVSPFDVAMILNKLGISVRAGAHCAEPVMQHYGIDGTVRASFALYNTKEEIDRLAEGVRSAMAMLYA